MTEVQWLESRDPYAMLDFLVVSGRFSLRRGRLFSVAVCRRVWHELADGRSRQAVEVAERFADGDAGEDELAEAKEAAGAARAAIDSERRPHPTSVPKWAAWEPCSLAGFRYVARCSSENPVLTRPEEGREGERAAHCGLLRDIFPFRPLHLDPAGGTPGLVSSAQAAYENRSLPSGHLDPDRLAVLADALEVAGCTDDRFLDHLRGDGPHVRGCWAIDTVLGKSQGASGSA